MIKKPRVSQQRLANEQGAAALLAATFDFLRRNNISGKTIVSYARQHRTARITRQNTRSYRRLVRAYEDMGVLVSTWFTHPTFLDKSGLPLPLFPEGRTHSVAHLLRVSRVRVAKRFALELMQRSPSIKSNSDGTLVALRRVFVLSEFEVPRAALVVERYLDTLRRNASGRKRATVLLLERSCNVPRVDRKTVAPILRDIKERGTAFMDSVDGEIEASRLRRSNRTSVGELGVLVFAWTRPKKRKYKDSKTLVH
jgi:hypothetical protein